MAGMEGGSSGNLSKREAPLSPDESEEDLSRAHTLTTSYPIHEDDDDDDDDDDEDDQEEEEEEEEEEDDDDDDDQVEEEEEDDDDQVEEESSSRARPRSMFEDDDDDDDDQVEEEEDDDDQVEEESSSRARPRSMFDHRHEEEESSSREWDPASQDWPLLHERVLSIFDEDRREHGEFRGRYFPRVGLKTRVLQEVVRKLKYISAAVEGDDEQKAKLPSSNEWEEMIIQKAEFLRRKMDFLHLVLSYPMKPEVHDRSRLFEDVERAFSRMNWQITKIQALLSSYTGNEHGKNLEEAIKKGINEGLFPAVERSLAEFDCQMVAYLPHEEEAAAAEADIIRPPSDESLSERIKVGLKRRQAASGTFEAPDQMWTMAINSAARHVSKCIEDGSFRKIGISGSRAQKVSQALMKGIPVISNKVHSYNVFNVSVSRDYSIKKIRQDISRQIRSYNDSEEEGSTLALPYNFLLLVDCVDDGQIDLHDLKIPYDRGFTVLTTPSQRVHDIMDLDLEIRMEDHLLPWELFCRNVGDPSLVNISYFQRMAMRLVTLCSHQVLAIIFFAKALKDVTYNDMWEHALDVAITGTTTREILFHALKFIWDQKDLITKHCMSYYAYEEIFRVDRDSLVSKWISKGLVDTKAEGEDILKDLINSSLLENVGENCVHMREEIRDYVQRTDYFFLPSLFLKRGKKKLTKVPEAKEWVYFKRVELMNNKLTKLPENPKCPNLKILWLYNNYDLMRIPPSFFIDMPLVRDLDLSCTSIKLLPSSISSLASLQKFNLSGCELLMELPSEIGELEKLEKFDLEGTAIMHLPKEMGNLINLRCFKVSFSRRANQYRETNKQTIPSEVVPTFSRLEEVFIDVNPYGDWWHTKLEETLKELGGSKKLQVLELIIPSVELLKQLRWDSTKLLYPDLSQFRFVVGGHPQRVISRLPHEVEEKFKKLEKSKKYLKYINGEGIATEITETLNKASVFFLDNHWTVKMLSELGNENMVELEFCLLVECTELESIIDGKLGVTFKKKPVLGQLRYLGIHYMKNLQIIWKGPINKGCLSNLTSLALNACFSLINIFTTDFIENLRSLEELIVEDCPKINCLVSPECLTTKAPDRYLRNLKKISLLDLPELVTISASRRMGSSKLDLVLIVYNCPKLDNLYTKETSTVYHKIVGEQRWWGAIKWADLDWKKRTQGAYEELKGGEDLMERLTKMVYSEQPTANE